MLNQIQLFVQISLIFNLPLAHSDIDIAAKFREWNIVPDIIKEPPPQLCHVSYENITVLPGDFVPRSITKKQPQVVYKCDEKKFHLIYLIAMTDGNIPKDSVQLERSDPLEYYVAPVWHNWIYINVPGSQVKRGQYLYDYVWPLNPRNASLIDRHALLVYEQDFRIFPPQPALGERYDWQEFIPLQDFVDNFALKGPIAGNFWYMKHDPDYIADGLAE